MFGRRRRPILGAAVVVGASRSAARHEVERQAAMNTQRELEIQREVELQRRNEEEQERRMQRAVDEAIQKAAVENPAPQPSAAALAPPPPQQATLHTWYKRIARHPAGATHAVSSTAAGILATIYITRWKAKECPRHQSYSARCRVNN
ncbi:Hypothetical protein NCS54_00879800 [Fusarium falciforme]|uniref:Hypothetical protein n=1 Tax=Fusarium falciforme TaxID=195108 RepID=UPI0023013F66|nr:Hypothetical protein NCS54_00879800 [Fusarium falciforme]WAO91331.1 Hypothetical protein NCS54_00879800 [Fusarium falciforme]